ncbi:hypothetical protein JCM11641_000278 [Rhodosporidiobolus odoratus]
MDSVASQTPLAIVDPFVSDCAAEFDRLWRNIDDLGVALLGNQAKLGEAIATVKNEQFEIAKASSIGGDGQAGQASEIAAEKVGREDQLEKTKSEALDEQRAHSEALTLEEELAQQLENGHSQLAELAERQQEIGIAPRPRKSWGSGPPKALVLINGSEVEHLMTARDQLLGNLEMSVYLLHPRKKLAELLVKHEVIAVPSTYEHFIRGFCNTSSNFVLDLGVCQPETPMLHAASLLQFFASAPSCQAIYLVGIESLAEVLAVRANLADSDQAPGQIEASVGENVTIVDYLPRDPPSTGPLASLFGSSLSPGFSRLARHVQTSPGTQRRQAGALQTQQIAGRSSGAAEQTRSMSRSLPSPGGDSWQLVPDARSRSSGNSHITRAVTMSERDRQRELETRQVLKSNPNKGMLQQGKSS